MRWRRLVVALALLSAVSAFAGGSALIASARTSDVMPLEVLEHTPFETFLVPGLLLAIVVGGTSLACAILVWRRSRPAIDATIVAGGTLTVWILAEIAMLRGFHSLQGIYGVLGLAILGLGVGAGWRTRAPRHRWVIAVTAAEATGFLAPTLAGVVSARFGLSVPAAIGTVAAGGLIEGLVLGSGQGWAIALPVRRGRYALLTALGASAVWLSVMATMSLGGTAFVVVAPVTAVCGLAAIGSAQWLELRHHAARAHRWIGWTALAWAVALPLSFAPSPFVDASTPMSSQLLLWGSAGALMAYVMAVITWQGVQRLHHSGGAFRGADVQAVPRSVAFDVPVRE